MRMGKHITCSLILKVELTATFPSVHFTIDLGRWQEQIQRSYEKMIREIPTEHPKVPPASSKSSIWQGWAASYTESVSQQLPCELRRWRWSVGLSGSMRDLKKERKCL